MVLHCLKNRRRMPDMSLVFADVPSIISVEGTPAVVAEEWLKFRIVHDDSCVTSCQRDPLAGFSPRVADV